ncbi:Arginase/deacetylase [Testicularia cyperi]|uniref:Arginase/deacetylase n=1 Tax=Testicularia cyperi TaxID=1882483 RepID=A0A317XLK4_9BASI|nr:Arginase/deacetylase [Testicularia cyperi]
MSVVSQDPRVAYVVSADLIRYSDLLPSNPGRSSRVHSLAYHLGLLDLSLLQQAEDDRSEEPDTSLLSATSGTESELAKFLQAVAADSDLEPAEPSQTQKTATVYRPIPATRSQLTGYHHVDFIQQLGKGIEAGDLEHPTRKRVKTHHTSNGTDHVQCRYADHGNSDNSLESSVEGENSHDSQDEMHLRPASSVKGQSRHRGYKRSAAKNQFGLQDDCPAFDGLGDHVALVAGAAITAADLIATGEADIAIAWDGGRHHAKKDAASGFCYVNDAVLAILALRKPRRVNVTATVPSDATNELKGASITSGISENNFKVVTKTTIKRIERVMYLDLDLHWGDGVEEAFYTSPHVLTMSIHHFAPGFFPCYAASSNPARFGPPGSMNCEGGVGSTSLSVPLLLGASDDSLQRIMQTIFQSVVEGWDPEAIVVQCGVDGLAGDPMSVWNLSASAYIQAVRTVLALRKPTLLLGGGGYNSPNAARCWSLLAAACLGRLDHEVSSPKRTAATRPHDEPVAVTAPSSVDQYSSPTRSGSSNDPHQIPKTVHATKTDDKLSYSSPIPDHKFWPEYGPDYTMEVKAGATIDQNDEAHFEALNKHIQKHIAVLAARPSNAATRTSKSSSAVAGSAS